MIYIPLQKQEVIHKNTKSLNQCPIIKAQTTDEIRPSENYENSIVIFAHMLLSKQATNSDQFSTRGPYNSLDIYYKSQSYFHLPKSTFRHISNIIILCKQTLRDIILKFHDIAGLDLILQERKSLCHKAWENVCDYYK